MVCEVWVRLVPRQCPGEDVRLRFHRPGALDWLLNVFRTFQKGGYQFIKNDFSGSLLNSSGKQYYNRKQTGLMRWRWTWRKIKGWSLFAPALRR